MRLSTKILRNQIKLLKPVITHCSIEMSRSAQDKLGKIMMAGKQNDLNYSYVSFGNFQAVLIRTKEVRTNGVILYLHGGGYVAGDLEYAMGFGSILAAESGIDVFCPAYRLAPEHPFPAALEDCEEAYRYLIRSGYRSDTIAFTGESAGGGLVYALPLKLKADGLPLPCCITAISPWSDLTQSGASYETNSKEDPSMTKERLDFFTKQYVPETVDPATPFASPVFGDLTGLPPSRIYVGGSEVMLDDAASLHDKLLKSGCSSALTICPGMWHAYMLYGTEDGKEDFTDMIRFIKEAVNERTGKQ